MHMATLEPHAYRKSDLLRPSPLSSATGRRATVGSPPPFIFSNSFEALRPPSRDGSGFPYRRRSTVSGNSQGHNVNDAPPLTAHGDANMNTMWSESASPSPVIPTTLLRGSSPTPSSSCESPKPIHATFDYEHAAFPHAIHSPFTLCPSPDFPPHFGQPRMPPPLPATFSTATSSAIRPSTAGTTTTPALSPAASSTSFIVEPILRPSNRSSPGLPDISLQREEFGSEVESLRHRVRQLEFINYLVRLRVAELESDDKTGVQGEIGLGLQFTADHSNASYPPSSSSNSANASPAFSFLNQELGPPPPDWSNRTLARLKRFCSLNRAGNALCAWHDSRRERRAHPPRMAPPNTLNCGCTYDEALFEESLARNGVGAFHPGDHVRMDPALRNPLLKLLEERYGYKDGDFERTANGGWREGEDAQSWEQKAAGSRNSRRDR